MFEILKNIQKTKAYIMFVIFFIMPINGFLIFSGGYITIIGIVATIMQIGFFNDLVNRILKSFE